MVPIPVTRLVGLLDHLADAAAHDLFFICALVRELDGFRRCVGHLVVECVRPMFTVWTVTKGGVKGMSLSRREGEPSLAIVTPSYSKDFELCSDLVESVRRFAAPQIAHHLIVPDSDREKFQTLSGPGTIIHSVAEYLPRSFLRVPAANVWINLRRPKMPVRGWVVQQIVKLSAVAALDVDIALVVDSDIVMIRHFGPGDFQVNGRRAMYRMPDAISDANLPRHVIWHRVARRILGLNGIPKQPLNDYISWPCAWEPRVCRMLVAHLDHAGGGSWQTLVASQLHFSEMILYGVYVDEILDPEMSDIVRISEMKCVTYDAETPLELEEYRQVLATVSADDLAVMISAKSDTSVAIRRQALANWQPPEGHSD